MSVSLYGSGNTVIQIQSTTLSTSFSSTATGFNNIPGLAVTITPQSTTSKILVIINVHGCGQQSTSNMFYQLLRNGTAIGNGTASGSGTPCISYATQAYNADNVYNSTINYLDSPATTSAVTYQMQFKNANSSGSIYINQSQAGTASGVDPLPSSNITVMEIAYA